MTENVVPHLNLCSSAGSLVKRGILAYLCCVESLYDYGPVISRLKTEFVPRFKWSNHFVGPFPIPIPKTQIILIPFLPTRTPTCSNSHSDLF
jgi:hypothetical protein